MTNFPYGVSSFGLPLIGSGPILTTGRVWFVHYSTGVDAAGRGDSPTNPLKTLDYAVGRCTANKGDVIILMPGHAESVIAAGTVTVDVAGITIIGLGAGTLRPTFTFSTATTATFLVSAANVTIKNLYFAYTGVDAIATGLSITGANCTISGCYFLLGDATNQAAVAVTPGTGSTNLEVSDCIFESPNGGPTHAIYSAVAVTGIKILRNYFIGHFSTACIGNATAAWVNYVISDNIFAVQSATGIGVSVGAAVGTIARNFTFVTANIGAGGSITATAAYDFENYGLEAAHAGSSATLDPAAGGWA